MAAGFSDLAADITRATRRRALRPRPGDPAEPVASLVRAAVDGDSQAWDALVGRFSALVWSIARSYRLNAADAADVSQVVWLRLVENLENIRLPDRLGAWLASVTRHECLRTLRKADREIAIDDHLGEVQETYEDEVALRLLAEQRDTAFWRAFADLPERWQAILRILMSSPAGGYEEVAAALDIPVGSIGPTRQRGLERLRHHPAMLSLALAG